MNRTALREAFLEFCDTNDWECPVAVTLTLRQTKRKNNRFIPITETQAQQNLRHFLNVLSRKIYKSKSNKRRAQLKCIPVLENKYQRKHFHYHLCVDKPAHVDLDTFTQMVSALWETTFWGNDQVKVTTADRNWLTYITKSHNLSDAIDWTNYNNGKRGH